MRFREWAGSLVKLLWPLGRSGVAVNVPDSKHGAIVATTPRGTTNARAFTRCALTLAGVVPCQRWMRQVEANIESSHEICAVTPIRCGSKTRSRRQLDPRL